MAPLSVYIHIPFCKSKCNYCSFTSFVNQDKKKGYLYSLLKEIDSYNPSEFLNTLYIGGGTPSIIEPEMLYKIYNKFNFQENSERTIEVNPNDVTKSYMSELHDIGFNRISMGAQSFDDTILEQIGRRHNSHDIYSAVEIIKEAGFDNISLDLIYGLPNQSIEGFKHDLTEVINLKIPHLSLYGLKIDEGCTFYKNPPQNLPSDDIQADMYLLAGEITRENGFEHYEISNYSLKNYHSRHNTNYWNCGEYYGFGVSAHGFIDGIRYSNTSDLEKYLNNPIEHEFGKFLTNQEKLEERIFLGFRLSKGLNINDINKDFNIDFKKKYTNVIDKYCSLGYIEETPFGYKLSDTKEHNGFLVSNIILSEFLE